MQNGEIQLHTCSVDRFLYMHMKEQLRAIWLILVQVSMPPPADLHATWCIFSSFTCLLQVCYPIVENTFILYPVSFLDLRVYKAFR